MQGLLSEISLVLKVCLEASNLAALSPAELRTLAELTTLDLDHAYPTPLSRESLRQLVASPRLSQLATLSFSCAGPALAACKVQSLRWLRRTDALALKKKRTF